jgi:DNA-binding transcriptional ArsR family regulator
MPTRTAQRTKPVQSPTDKGIAELERKAGEAAGLLKLMANENRLLILCRLFIAGEMSVTSLAKAVNLSQSALSQHLAKMRDDGLLATRRDAQTIYYRIADPNAARLLDQLKDIYCP